MSGKPAGVKIGYRLSEPEWRQGMQSKRLPNALWAALVLTILTVLTLNACTPTSDGGGAAPTQMPTAAPVDLSAGDVCVDKDTGASLSYQEAVDVAQDSECLVEKGQLKETRFCNEDTGTWWIDLEMEMPNCNPACVVDLNSKTAEINGRCLGALPPQDTGEPITPTAERSAVAWYGYVVSAPAGSGFDDYLIVLPDGTAEVGLTGADHEIEAQIAALRDQEPPNNHAHFWGALTCDSNDYGGCQLVVSRLRPDGPGPFFDPDPVEGWEGMIFSGPPGLQVDDYFVLVGDLNLWYGIWGADPAIDSQLEDLRDTGTVIRVWGDLLAGIMDGNGTQIQVSRFEIVEEAYGAVPSAPEWPEADDGMEVYLNEDYWYQLRVPPTATITGYGAVGFSADEVPEGMTADDYITELQEQYGSKLCVHIEYGLGYMYISAPPNEGFRYVPCGLTGLGAGETVERTHEVTIAGQTYTAQGFEWIGNMAPCSPPRETLDCHNEMMRVVLDDGTQIEYGARHEPTATFEDYLTKGKAMLLQILTSYEPTPARPY